MKRRNVIEEDSKRRWRSYEGGRGGEGESRRRGRERDS